jgi:hypothetical protein
MHFFLIRYITKKKISKYYLTNKKLNKKINNKLNFKENNFLKKKYFFFNSSFGKNLQINQINYYNIYISNFNFIKKNFNHIKYEKLLNLVKLKKLNQNINKIILSKINNNVLTNFILIYNFFLNSIYLDIFYFNKFLKNKNRIFFFLILSFKKKKLYINLQNNNKKNYLSISTGLFIKFFDKRKSIKKNKAIKLLMVKYLRKLFIISKINNLILVIKKTPLFINELINFLNTPIAHKYINPIDQKIIDESLNKYSSIRFSYFIFTENKNFSKNKMPSKGRIKRKILRKITFENKIID